MSVSSIHTVLTLIILALLGIIIDPLAFWMPDIAITTSLIAIIILVIIWAAFLIREKPEDERDAVHMMTAGRHAYLAGVATLTLALFFQGTSNTIDVWIILAPAMMLTAKLFARWYSDTYE